MKIRSHFVSLYACLLVVLVVSCTSHQRPVARNGEQTAKLGAGAAVSTGLPAAGPADSQLVGNNGRQPAAQTQAQTRADAGGGPVTFYAVKMVETAPVSSLPSSTAEADKTQSQPGVEMNELNDVQVKQNMPGPGPTASSARTSSIQAVTSTSPSYLFDFEGNSSANNTAFFGGTVAPPDTNGAVGPNHYVQYVNLLVGVYDKTPAHNLIGGRFALSSFFAPLGGVCATTNDGDPVVLYDKLSDRWILSQFGFTALNTPPYHECIGISKTSDPTGAYYAYDFLLPGQEFPDYPKLGTWPDAYYMSTNQFFQGGGFDGAGAFAFDRAKMLVGDPTATGIYFNLCFTTGHCSPSHPEGIFGMLPSDFDGLAVPPAGIPNPFLYPTATLFGDPTDGLRIFYFNVGSPFGTSPTFAERAGSSYGSPEVAIGPYDPRSPGTRAAIRQPPPATNADSLDSVGERMMYRMQYMNFAGTEKLVTNITVNLSGVNPTSSSNYRAAVHYFDLQRTSPGGAFSVNDEGTQAPTTDGRWMASAAADNSADVAVGYTISSTTVHPSLAFAGRLPGDPAGTLGPEQTLFAGVGVQRGTGNRWGDYSALQLDPTDFCTFWYTNEYYTTTTATFNWQTRIGGFKFPTCASPLMGKLVGTVTYCADGTPISGAVITVSDGHGGATIADGTYSINLPPGTYSVSASDPAINCAGSASQTVTITDGATTTADFCLTGTPLIDLVSESFDDSAGNNNGVINQDECVKINTVLKNDGCFPETGIVAVLSTSTPGVVVDQPFSAYPNLAINASGANITPYQIHTTPGFVCGTPIAFTLTENSTLGGTRVFHFSFPTCGGGASQTFSGTLTNTDASSPQGRLGRNAVSSVCGTAKACPGPITPITPRFYDTFPFVNTATVPVCLTVTLNQSACGAPGAGVLIAGAYLDSFDPNNLCTNYLGDPGGSPDVGSFSVDVPGGHTLVVSIQQVGAAFCTAGYSGTVSGFLDNSDGGGACPTAVCATCASPVQAIPYPITNCSGGDVKASGRTLINLPTKDVVLQCALAELPGTNGITINAHSIKVDGPSGGSITTNGKTGTQLNAGTTAGSTCDSGATIEVKSASILDNNPNGGLKMLACGNIVMNGSTVKANSSANLEATSTNGKICSRENTLGGNQVLLTASGPAASGDLTLVGTAVQASGARSAIKVVSTNGSVLAGSPAGCPPNSFTSAGNDGDMAVSANGVTYLSNACVDVAENITVTAAGAGKACLSDIIIDLTGAVVRNDFGKPGVITMTACAGGGLIEDHNAILADSGAKSGGSDPNAVSNLNGGKKTDPSAPLCSESPACGGPVSQPVSADQADRIFVHHVVGVPKCDS